MGQRIGGPWARASGLPHHRRSNSFGMCGRPKQLLRGGPGGRTNTRWGRLGSRGNPLRAGTEPCERLEMTNFLSNASPGPPGGPVLVRGSRTCRAVVCFFGRADGPWAAFLGAPMRCAPCPPAPLPPCRPPHTSCMPRLGPNEISPPHGPWFCDR